MALGHLLYYSCQYMTNDGLLLKGKRRGEGQGDECRRDGHEDGESVTFTSFFHSILF